MGVGPSSAGSVAPPGGGESMMDDADVVRRMAAGDELALGAFYDRWRDQVYGLVLHVVREAADAEDVMEEVFWQAWRQAGRFDAARGGVGTWLLTIARSRALDRLRATRRRREESIDDDAGEKLASSAEPTFVRAAADPSLALEHKERRQMIMAALGDLPREQREALELGYFGGLSQSEIAERTGQPLGTIKTRMRLAMQKLRDRLSPLREVAR
jgi:RNA polymerase sigma-70 factor (ECF subfamily)